MTQGDGSADELVAQQLSASGGRVRRVVSVQCSAPSLFSYAVMKVQSLLYSRVCFGLQFLAAAPFKAVRLSVDGMKFTRSLHGLPWLAVDVLRVVSARMSGLLFCMHHHSLLAACFS